MLSIWRKKCFGLNAVKLGYRFKLSVVGRWVDNIRINLGEVGWSDVDWIGLGKDRNRWRALVNSVLNLRVLLNAGKLSSSLTSSGLSSSAQLHRVSCGSKCWPCIKVLTVVTTVAMLFTNPVRTFIRFLYVVQIYFSAFTFL
jgi:hypothetical protein